MNYKFSGTFILLLAGLLATSLHYAAGLSRARDRGRLAARCVWSEAGAGSRALPIVFAGLGGSYNSVNLPLTAIPWFLATRPELAGLVSYFPAQNCSFSAVVNCARRRKTRRG